jgi:hypothetical protein
MGTQQSTVDSRSPDQIAKATVKVNKTPELRRGDKEDVNEVLGPVPTWPKPAQEEAVASLRAIEPRMGDRQRIPRDAGGADCSEVATDKEVEAAFRFFGAA